MTLSSKPCAKVVEFNGVGILPGHHQSYIDHLVPLCQILEIPILVTDPWIKELVERYYPPMKILLAEPIDYNLDPALEGYDVFVYVDFFRKATGSFQFQDYLCRHKVRSVISLHGNPDKYWEMYWLEKLNDEDVILAYGPQLVKLLKKKGISKEPVVTGNYRLNFYKEHETFFDQKLPIQKNKKTILYAPTWAASARASPYRDQYSPFLNVYRKVFEMLSKDYQLIVKLHPHLFQIMPDEIERIMEDYPHIFFLNHFPLIYPLLKQIDLYLGDYSSIGYDFLFYDRPLFFLETQGLTALQNYGQRITIDDLPNLIPQLARISHKFSEEIDPLSTEIGSQDSKDSVQATRPCYVESQSQLTECSSSPRICEKCGLGKDRLQMYHEVYGEEKALREVKKDIENACRSDSQRQ